MATKEELTKGIELLIQEGHRLANDLSEAQWEHVVDLDGWKSKEVLAHVAGIGSLVVPMVGGLATAAPGADAMASVDIDQMNAGIVASKAGKSAKELALELETSYRGVIDWLKSVPEETLAKRATVRGYKDVPVSDLVNRMVILHGAGHIYSVYSSIMNAN
jgi:Mycothiol maleylpyruvate isomerase N-terminal domain